MAGRPAPRRRVGGCCRGKLTAPHRCDGLGGWERFQTGSPLRLAEASLPSRLKAPPTGVLSPAPTLRSKAFCSRSISATILGCSCAAQAAHAVHTPTTASPWSPSKRLRQTPSPHPTRPSPTRPLSNQHPLILCGADGGRGAHLLLHRLPLRRRDNLGSGAEEAGDHLLHRLGHSGRTAALLRWGARRCGARRRQRSRTRGRSVCRLLRSRDARHSHLLAAAARSRGM